MLRILGRHHPYALHPRTEIHLKHVGNVDLPDRPWQHRDFHAEEIEILRLFFYGIAFNMPICNVASNNMNSDVK